MWTEADQMVEAVLHAEPAHTKAQLMKAWILIQDGRPSKALDFLADIQVQDPADVKTRDHIREVGEARRAENPYELA